MQPYNVAALSCPLVKNHAFLQMLDYPEITRDKHSNLFRPQVSDEYKKKCFQTITP
jgi:hypothetical protein